MIIFLVSNSFIGFLCALIFLVIGGSLNSGSIEALFYESLKKLHDEERYDTILSYAQILAVGTGVITNFVAPYLFDINPKLPFVVSLFFSVIGFIISLFIIETHTKLSRKLTFNQTRIESNIILKKTFSLITSNKLFLCILLFSTFFGSVIGSFGDLFNQPLIYDYFGIELYGILFSLATVVQTIIIYFTPKLIAYFKDSFYLFLIFLWIMSLFVIMYFKNTYLTIIFIGIIWSVGSFLFMFISKKVQQLVKDDDIRASTHSLINLFKSGFVAIIIFLGGFLIDKFSIEVSLLILNGVLLSISLVIGVILLKLNSDY